MNRANDFLLRFSLLLPTLLFGLSRMSPLTILCCFPLLAVSRVTGSRRLLVTWMPFAACFLLLSATLIDRPIQGPTNFPTWNGINERSYILSVDFFQPTFETVKGEEYTLVYYYGVHALVGTIHRILPTAWQGEIALETIIALLALSYSALGLGLLLSAIPQLRIAPLSAAILILFLPGIELVPHLMRSFFGETSFSIWPHNWLGYQSDFLAAAQPESGWSLAWVPQQVTLLFMQAYFWMRDEETDACRVRNRCLVIASALSTSVFVAIGWLIALAIDPVTWKSTLRNHRTHAMVSLVSVSVIGVLTTFFYTNKMYSEIPEWALGRWDLSPIAEFFIMLGFVAVENFWLILALSAGLLLPLRRHTFSDEEAVEARQDSRRVMSILIALVFLAQVRLGIFNDLYMRTSTPLVLLATVYVVKWLTKRFNRKLQLTLIVVAVTTGFLLQVCAHFVEERPARGSWRGMNPVEWRAPESEVNKQYRGKVVEMDSHN